MTLSTPTAAGSAERRARLLVALICALGLRLAGTGLGDEGAVSLDGDMPRYLMNGVFLRDLAQDFPLSAPLTYADHYYARYPALSLGHHPILPAIILVPFYLLFGISVFAARLSVLAALVISLIVWFRLVQSIYGTTTAAFASILLLTTPGFPALFRVVLSEPYAICLVLCSLYAMHRYGQTERMAYAVGFVVAVVAAAYAKQVTVAMFPVYAFQLANALGIRRLIAPRSLIMAAIIVVSILPLVPLTLKYSQFNVLIVTRFVDMNDRALQSNYLRFLRRIVAGPFGISPVLLALAAVSIAGAAFRRDRRLLLFVVWVVSIYVSLTALGVGNDRFTCYWLPAFAAIAAASLHVGRSTASRGLLAGALTVAVAYQLWTIGDPAGRERGNIRLSGATGYEEAAAFVTSQRHGDVVLYSAAVDTGYFAFFMRKHDPAREMVLLRADKVLTTSLMNKLDFKRQTQSPEEILPLIRKYGVGYVVIEHGQYPEGPLRWLEEVVKADAFVEVRHIPVTSSDRRLRDGSISIYRYRGETAIDPDAHLSITVRAMGSQIGVRLQDLVPKRLR